ncbi:hypothetical protein D1007_61685 [Hordeum vulgare]|nr:hypothetical protein D1007_61685 [Hordeum vulgare]
MAERYPGDGAVANSFASRHLKESEARLLYEANYPTPSDMRASSSWKLSANGVPAPPPPSGADRHAEIAHIRLSLSASSRKQPRYAPDSNTLWTAYFERRHANQLAPTNNADPRGRFNSEGVTPMVGRLRPHVGVCPRAHRGRQLAAFGIPGAPSFSRRRDSSLTPRRMETTSSSSSGSRSRSSGSHVLLPVKTEPLETPLGWRMRNGVIVINEGGSSSRLAKPKTEPALLPVKQEHLDMAVDDETSLKWARDDYVREEMERHRLGREEGDIVILDDSDEEAPRPSNPVRHGDPGEGVQQGRWNARRPRRQLQRRLHQLLQASRHWRVERLEMLLVV